MPADLEACSSVHMERFLSPCIHPSAATRAAWPAWRCSCGHWKAKRLVGTHLPKTSGHSPAAAYQGQTAHVGGGRRGLCSSKVLREFLMKPLHGGMMV